MLTFIGILLQSLAVFLELWFITLPLLILLIWSLYKEMKSDRSENIRLTYLLLYLIPAPLIISMIGAIFYDTKNNFAEGSILVLYTITIAYSIFLLFKIKDSGILVFSFLSLVFLLTSMTTLASSMSIANDWM